MIDALSFHVASLPQLAMLAGMFALLATALLLRGQIFIRASLIAMCVAGLAWMTGQALLLALETEQTALVIARLSVASWSLFGAACLAFLLSMDGTLYRHRRMVLSIIALASLSFIAAGTTDLMVADVYELSWGGWHPSAGPLLVVHAALLPLPVLLGLRYGRRQLRRDRIAAHTRYGNILAAFTVAAAIEGVLLCSGVGVYPFIAIPGCAVAGLGLYAIIKHDLVHARGFDRATAYEVLIFVGLAYVVSGIVWASIDQSAILALFLMVPIFGGAQATSIMIRKYVGAQRLRSSDEVEVAVERLADNILDYRSREDLSAAVVSVLEDFSRLSDVRLWICDTDRDLLQVGQEDEAPLRLSGKLHRWFIMNSTPLDRDDLPILRIRSVEEPLDALFDAMGADVLVPLADRGRLVGLIAASSPTQGRVLADSELQILLDVGTSVAKSLTFINLFVEAEKRVEIEKELEVAAAVKLGRRVGEARHFFHHAQVLGHFMPAAQFSGAWWSTYELPDHRVLVVVGDVSGHGVAAALVSSTAAAACQTAQSMMGAECNVQKLLKLLNDAVRRVGDVRYEMGCCAVIIDRERGTMTFSNGSSQTPYLVRPTGDGHAKLFELPREGMLLGHTKPPLGPEELEIRDGDLLVLYSDVVVDALDPDGERFGTKRLRALAKRELIGAGERAHEVIVDALASHCGESPLTDDLTVVVVRIGVKR